MYMQYQRPIHKNTLQTERDIIHLAHFNSLHMSTLGGYVKWSLVLIVPEVQALNPHPLGLLLINLLLKCHPPLTHSRLLHVFVIYHNSIRGGG